MYKDIYDLLIKKSNQGRIFSKNDIIYIGKRLANSFGVDEPPFDVDVYYDYFATNSRAHFELDTKHIVFNLKRFKYAYKNETAFISNVAFIYEITHELIHCEQAKLIKSNSFEDLKDPLLKLEYYLNQIFYDVLITAARPMNVPTVNQMKILKNVLIDNDEHFYENLRGLYNKFHDEITCERFAAIRGLKFTLDFLESNSKGKKREELAILALKRALYEKYLCGYWGSDLFSTPIETFMRRFGFREDIPFVERLIDEINTEYNLDNETRLEYGLNTTDKVLDDIEKENKKINKEIKKLNKKKPVNKRG